MHTDFDFARLFFFMKNRACIKVNLAGPESGNRFVFISFIPPIYGIYYRSVILYHPKGIDACKKSTFIVNISYLLMEKVDIIVLVRVFIDDLGETAIDLSLIDVLCIFGNQYIFGKQ